MWLDFTSTNDDAISVRSEDVIAIVTPPAGLYHRPSSQLFLSNGRVFTVKGIVKSADLDKANA